MVRCCSRSSCAVTGQGPASVGKGEASGSVAQHCDSKGKKKKTTSMKFIFRLLNFIVFQKGGKVQAKGVCFARTFGIQKRFCW